MDDYECLYRRAQKNLTVLKMTYKRTFSLELNSNQDRIQMFI